ncbi:MAG: glyceraldehyde-3-phosphate dehydrogenase [Chlamydiae bacterium SM23_39]|nr:MAG: glyceraldehyde-3-phosphate dehydrogenase [Chlamydiae bacterium SM23_39]
MALKIAINGFGRIGRLVYRIAHDLKDIEIVAINDLVPPNNLAYLLKYDSAHGIYERKIEAKENSLIVDGKKTLIFSEKDPSRLPWKDLKIDYVLESTGLFTKREDANKHISAGARRVIISAPAKDSIPTFVMGVNHDKYNPSKDFIINNASCTTNCLAPIVKILLDNFGIEEGLVTTIHAMTATQHTVDAPSKKNFRLGRSAGYNIIPSTTGAAKAVIQCIPEVEGKLTAMAFRVPVIDVSVVDLTVRVEKSTSYDEICDVMKKASTKEMKNILQYTEEELVSSDFLGNPYSSIFDKKAGIELSDRFYKLIAWYDNEAGYAHRIIDLFKYMENQE